MVSISCILPAYNEERNIGDVLRVVSKVQDFCEIIVIDDGSKDRTSEIVKSFIGKDKRIKLVINKKNLGKTGAVIKGIELAQGKVISMIDADLINLSVKNIKDMIHPVVHEKYSLVILDRAGDRKAIWGWTTCARFVGGERTFWKKDILKLNPPHGEGGFLLESIMNLYFIEQGRKTKSIYCDNLYTLHDYNKTGLKEGASHYWEMSKSIIKSTGPLRFLSQIWGVEDDRISWMYTAYQTPGLKFIVAPVLPIIALIDGILNCIFLNIRGFDILPKKEQIDRLRKWGYKIGELSKEKVVWVKEEVKELNVKGKEKFTKLKHSVTDLTKFIKI